jgi:Phosphate acetyl/butaryl transferase
MVNPSHHFFCKLAMRSASPSVLSTRFFLDEWQRWRNVAKAHGSVDGALRKLKGMRRTVVTVHALHLKAGQVGNGCSRSTLREKRVSLARLVVAILDPGNALTFRVFGRVVDLDSHAHMFSVDAAQVSAASKHHQRRLHAAALCKMADRGQIKGAILDGPLGFDNAISKDAATTKGINSEVAGDPDILLAPDLESGNMLAKQLTFLAQAESAGLVLGARIPIVLTSRADSVRSRIASCAVAMLAAHARRNKP